MDNRMENLTHANVQELLRYVDEERFNIQEQDDYATDDDKELDNSYTDVDYRAEEKIEEAQRKEQKKKWRNKKQKSRADAKDAAAGKVDKEGEDKKKKAELGRRNKQLK